MPLQGGHAPPFSGGTVITGQSVARGAEYAHVVLGDHMSLFRGLTIPVNGLDHILGQASVTSVVQDSQGELGLGIAFFGVGLPHAHRLGAMAGVVLHDRHLIRTDGFFWRT